jgi:hypothetical protein
VRQLPTEGDPPAALVSPSFALPCLSAFICGFNINHQRFGEPKMLNNGQNSKASKEFKEKINKLNNMEDLIDTVKTAIQEVIELEITTWVSEASNALENQSQTGKEVIKPGNRMYTRINLIDGDIENEIGSQFVGNGSYTELREFHLNQVKEGREIIQKNIESIQKMYEILKEMLKTRKTSQPSINN